MSPVSTWVQLEPRESELNLAAGFTAAVHDPAWFLARQWQMGELQGENASTPVRVNYSLSSTPITGPDPRFDPAIQPAEFMVESEIDDWWTTGRRVRIGKLFAAVKKVLKDESVHFMNPPPPYERFAGSPDGLLVWHARKRLRIADKSFGSTIPADSTPAWDPEQLLYEQGTDSCFAAGTDRLVVKRHRGGRLDWHSVDATPAAGATLALIDKREVIPTPLSYPGAPASRWWEIEDAAVDFGGYAPDSAHTATAILTDLIFSHSDDWFTFPITGMAGHVIAIEKIDVLDSFGRHYDSDDLDGALPRWPGLQPPEDWTLFKIDGMSPPDEGLPVKSLVLWHVAELPLQSGAIERVQFGLDEQSNLLWAVERIVDAREVESRPLKLPAGPRFNEGKPPGDVTTAREYAYVPAVGIVPRWHPYNLSDDDDPGSTRILVQRSLVDLSRQSPGRMPAPEAEVLQTPAGASHHQILPVAVPSNGMQVERRWMLARDMAGNPVLWIEREQSTLLSPPGRLLRFDVMELANVPPG